MKLHHIIAVLFVVVLTGAGYTLTVWQHATLAHDADHKEDASSEAGAQAAATHETNAVAEGSVAGAINGSSAQDVEHVGSQTEEVRGAQATATNAQSDTTSEAGATESAQTGNGSATPTAATEHNASDAPQPGTAAAAVKTTTVAGTSVTFTVTVTRQKDAKTPLVTIALSPSDKPLSLSGWRLADVIGVAGHADHVYYFGALTLDAGETLTVHSSCGRDDGLIRYWCLSQPLSLLDAANKELYFLNANGNRTLTCTPAASGQDAMPYQCAPF